ncbi:pentapeptide repeat-containing protein [Streptomyces sp. NPDC093225]|uniref:pentapeptide repeat-containing protein n=1 Tax=Streptomyces sp. NPDC093225 TaxID=3366034 RepID=UPI00381B5E51
MWKRVEKTVALLASLSAFVLVGFTWKSITQVSTEQAIAREGQLTDRYMAAVQLLDNRSEEVRMGGIYGLSRIMHDSRRDQPTVMQILSAFLRTHNKKLDPVHFTLPGRDFDAALAILTDKNNREEGDGFADLPGIHLEHFLLKEASLRRANLSGAHLAGVVLRDADLSGARLGGADLSSAFLTRANLTSANLGSAELAGAQLSGANLWCANLRYADLEGAEVEKGQLMSAVIDVTTILPRKLAGDPQLKEKAASRVVPKGCEPS